MRDSVQYSNDEFGHKLSNEYQESLGMSSVSQITKQVVHNKETKLGIMQ